MKEQIKTKLRQLDEETNGHSYEYAEIAYNEWKDMFKPIRTLTKGFLILVAVLIAIGLVHGVHQDAKEEKYIKELEIILDK